MIKHSEGKYKLLGRREAGGGGGSTYVENPVIGIWYKNGRSYELYREKQEQVRA
jgi:hypothetical protein